VYGRILLTSCGDECCGRRGDELACIEPSGDRIRRSLAGRGHPPRRPTNAGTSCSSWYDKEGRLSPPIWSPP